MSQAYTGKPLPRREDLPLVTGQARFVDNIAVPGALYMVVVRSPLAHARIGQVDVLRARRMPGVVAALDGRELADAWASPLPCIWSVTDETNLPDHWPLAVDEAKYVGDGVAVVVARSLSEAKDAAETVQAEYDWLPAVADVESALRPDAPLVHPRFGTNRCFRLQVSHGEDVDAIFDRAEVRIARTFRHQRLIPAPMEPRSVLAEPHPATGEMTLWTSTQVPHLVQRTLAPCVSIPQHKLRVIAPDVGGGFGAKLNVYAEEALAVAVAQRLGSPVRWVEERSESATATAHGRGQVQRIELAATREGKILAIRGSILASMGAYLQLETPGIPIVGRFMYGGAYRAEGYSLECIGVFTNQTPTGAYRGAGRPEAAYAIERMVDLLATEVGMDPADIRRENFIPAGERMENAAGIEYDSVDYERGLNKALEMVGYHDLRGEQARRRRQSATRQLGIGLASYVDSSGIGPSAALSKTNYLSGGWEYGRVRMLAGGEVEVTTGSVPQGQGHVTAWSQIAADAFGTTPEAIKVYHGDTAVVPMGTGTFGSRSLIVGGTAIHLAAQHVGEKAKRIAAHLLEVAEEDVVFSDGRFLVVGSPDRAIPVADVARAAYLAHSLPEGMEPGLAATTVFDPEDWTYPFGTHVAVVEVDVETGDVDLVKYVAVDDCGSVVNPVIVDGQIHGGLAQGIGQALFEEVRYMRDGQLQNGSFMDYLIPAASELPSFDVERTVTPSPLNPLGAKGIGEAGTIAAPPAVMNAIHDAVPMDEVDMPATPERVWRAIRLGPETPRARETSGHGDRDPLE